MTIRTLTIVGAGTMGSGIAVTAVAAGIDTVLIDADPAALVRARNRARQIFDRRRSKGQMTDAQAAGMLERLATATDLNAGSGSDLVIEAVFEDAAVKHKLFAELSPLLRADAVVATNTSCLRVDEIARSVVGPERFLGLHYFSPAEVNPLVEVVGGALTDPAAVEAVKPFLVATGKVALVCRDSNGFAVNRFFCPYTNEAVRCADEGLATPGQIDAVAREIFELALGPFAVMNIIKPRINLHAIYNLASHGRFYEPAASMIETGLADQGWTIDDTPALAPDRAHRVAERLMAALFLPVLQALDEGVAAPADFDRGARLALKFGRPPFALMNELGMEAVRDLVRPLAERYASAMPASLALVGIAEAS